MNIHYLWNQKETSQLVPWKLGTQSSYHTSSSSLLVTYSWLSSFLVSSSPDPFYPDCFFFSLFHNLFHSFLPISLFHLFLPFPFYPLFLVPFYSLPLFPFLITHPLLLQSSREQLAIGAFAQSLLVIPNTLSVNAAKDATDLVPKLRAYHHSSQVKTEHSQLKNYGLDLLEGEGEKVHFGFVQFNFGWKRKWHCKFQILIHLLSKRQ